MSKILISSVGSLVGYNVLDTLERRRNNLEIIGTNSIPGDANIFRCDKAYLVPATKSRPVEFANKIKEIIELEKPKLVIPGRDDDLSVLSSIKANCPELAPIILCGNQKTVRHITDKWFTYEFSVQHRLPFAASAIPDHDTMHSEVKQLVAAHGYPLLVKPRRGFASHGVSIIANDDQLGHALDLRDVLIQQNLNPSAKLDQLYARIQNTGIPLFFSLEEAKYSLQTFIDQDRSVGRIFCTLHNMVSGRSLKVEKIENDVLEHIAYRFASALAAEGWFGPLNIQLQKLPSGEFKAYELNGRFTGATSARYFLGFDEVGNALSNVCGIELGRNRHPTVESRQVNRFVTTLPIPNDAVRQLSKQGIWEKRGT